MAVHVADLRRLIPMREWAPEAHSLADTLESEISALRTRTPQDDVEGRT